jgi:hypothetical protein
MRFDGVLRRHLEIMTGAGIVAGLIYWMIAGRSAGAWREPRRPLQPPPPLPSHPGPVIPQPPRLNPRHEPTGLVIAWAALVIDCCSGFS